MEICGDSLDRVLIELYQTLLNSPSHNHATRGNTSEKLSVLLRITKPRARLSRSETRGKPFSALGELLWYLSGSDKLTFIEPYIGQYKEEAIDGKIYGAYGPRLLAMRGTENQIENVSRLLRERPASRRAVIQLFNAEDISRNYPEIPCTTTLQFHLRDKQLHLSVTLRSNDAYLGLPHDVFCFTMLQEMMACRLEVELGEYHHFAGSMHLYDKHRQGAERYIREGYQKSIEMPAMPKGDAFDLTSTLIEFETKIRKRENIDPTKLDLDPYWADIVRLLEVFWASDQDEFLDRIRAEFTNPIYRSYLDERRGAKPRDDLR